jgi:hypothetical protein
MSLDIPLSRAFKIRIIYCTQLHPPSLIRAIVSLREGLFKQKPPIGGFLFGLRSKGLEGRISKASCGRFARPGQRRREVAPRKAQATRRRSGESSHRDHAIPPKWMQFPRGFSLLENTKNALIWAFFNRYVSTKEFADVLPVLKNHFRRFSLKKLEPQARCFRVSIFLEVLMYFFLISFIPCSDFWFFHFLHLSR